MKKKFDLKKWIFNYLFYGYFISIVFINICNYIFYKKFDLSLRTLKGNFMVAFLIMPLSLGFKSLYYEYKEIWKTAELDRKIFIILGIIFVVYGVYYRAKLTWSFK